MRVDSPETAMKQNQVTLLLGTAIYLTLGALIYWKKIPEAFLAKLPDQKYLFVMIAIDLALYFVIYRFQHGIFPPMSMKSISSLPSQTGGGLIPPSKKSETKSKRQTKKSQSNRLSKSPISLELDDEDSLMTTTSDINLDDDLESCLKRPGQTRQTPHHLPLEEDISELSTQPQEASVPGKDYFQDNDSKTVVENWDVDEFTQEEYVPDEEEPPTMIDEMIIE